MANIAQKVAQIRNAILGKDVRESLASGIESINTEVESTTQRQAVVETTVAANEAIRQAAEDTRISNENTRISNDEARAEEHTLQMTEVDQIKSAYDVATKANLSVEVSNARGSFGTLEARMDDSDSQFASYKAEIANQQDWYEVFKRNRVGNLENMIFKKADDNNLDIYINHFSNTYQKWKFKRDTVGLDNAVASHANGDAWQVNTVTGVLLGTGDQVLASDVEMTKSGTWTNYSGVFTSDTTGDYMECTVFGSDVLMRCTIKNNGGIADITIDGVVIGQFDFYNVSSGGWNTIFRIANGLSNENHTVRVTIKGTKNAASSGYSARIQHIEGVSNAIDYTDMSTLVEFPVTMPSTRNFRYGLSAIEIAVNSTYNGNSVWSGAYHKYLYPSVTDNQKIYIDGIEKVLSGITTGAFYFAKDIRLTQELKLANGINDIADVKLIQHFTSEGYHVKWFLDWLVDCVINTSYSAMFGTSVDKLIFGDAQTVVTAVKDDAEKGDYNTYNFMGWQSQDNYIVAFKALNVPAMKYTNTAKKMYFRDRVTDAKLYVPRFEGNVSAGEKWQSEFIVSIAKCNDVNSIMPQ